MMKYLKLIFGISAVIAIIYKMLKDLSKELRLSLTEVLLLRINK